MKFRIAISVLSIVIIGLFLTVFFLVHELQEEKQALKSTKEALQEMIKSSKQVLATRDSLLLNYERMYLKVEQLDSITETAEDRTEVISRNENYSLGITIQAKNSDYQKMISFIYETGFQLDYIIQKRVPISDAPVIYYYSPKAKSIAEDFKNDLIEKLPDLYVENFKIQLGSSNKPDNTIIAKLMFKY